MKAYFILINILLSKVAFLAILTPHRKLLINRINSEQNHKNQGRILQWKEKLKIGANGFLGFILGFYSISFFLKNFAGLEAKKQILGPIEKSAKPKMRNLVLKTYSSVSKVLDKAKVHNHSIERILKNNKIWKNLLSNKNIMSKTKRIWNKSFDNFSNLPLQIQKQLDQTYQSKTVNSQIISRKLTSGGSSDITTCGDYFCSTIFLIMFAVGMLIGFMSKWIEQSKVDSAMYKKFKGDKPPTNSSSKGRKLGVLSDLVKQIGSFTALNSSKSKKSSGSNFIQNLGVKFLTGQSSRKQKKIVNIFSNIFSILPKNIKNMLTPSLFV